MKTTLLFIVLFFVGVSQAQLINFPDPNLKAILSRISVDDAMAKDAFGNAIIIDVNENQEIEITEALQVFSLNLDNNNNPNNPLITDLNGIQFFTNLTHLSVTTNDLQALDVRTLVNLTKLTCNENPRLSNLNISGLDQLDILTAYHCNISNLDISGCTNLRLLACYDNVLEQIDFSGIQKLELLLCQQNQLTNLNLSGNKDLHALMCGNNNLSSIYVKDTALGLFSFDENPNLQYVCINSESVETTRQKTISYGYANCVVDDSCILATNNFTQPQFTIFPNPANDILNFTSDKNTTVRSIAIYNLLGQKIITKDNKAIESVDVSALSSGNYFIKINSDKGTTNARFAKK